MIFFLGLYSLLNSSVPTWLLYPMVIFGTLATVVAAQALISAVFSLTRQASQLGLSSRMFTKHTSDSSAGQIYLPALNWMLMLGTIAVVLIFRSSDSWLRPLAWQCRPPW